MWTIIARIILRNRIAWLVLIAATTVFMAYKGRGVVLSYEFGLFLPADDPVLLDNQQFLETFAYEGDLIALAVSDPKFFDLKEFGNWWKFSEEIKQIEGVVEVFSVSDAVMMTRNDSQENFGMEPLFSSMPQSQAELDSIKNRFFQLPLYKGILYNEETGTYLMAVRFSKEFIDSERRIESVDRLNKAVAKYSAETGLKVHVSGFPYIRTTNTEIIRKEIPMFIGLALLITAMLLFFFLRSVRAVVISVLVVGVAVIWSVGIMGIFGYSITILTALIPPLLIVIGIPNCIFLLNKYHQEYLNHGNQVKSLSRVIHKIGAATLLTNATTASGFATFILTSSRILVEFGVVASICIMSVFVLSLLLMPILYSFMNAPKDRHTRHLEKKWIRKVIGHLEKIILKKRPYVYITTAVILVFSIYGITKMKKTGEISEDLPKSSALYQDMKFFEDEFKGILPFEVFIDTKRKKGAYQLSTLKRMDELQAIMDSSPYLSPSLSIANLAKYSKQAYYNGDSAFYELPNSQERNWIFSYLGNTDGNNAGLLSSFTDSTGQYARISANVADIGIKEMGALQEHLYAQIDSIFEPEKYEVKLTGNSVVFIRGTNFLVNNLFISLALAIIIISMLMALLFRSARMVFISLVPNIIPLMVTAALMGYLNIPIKPSTILVFSVAFGISVDDTIHFLAKFRQELKHSNWNIGHSTKVALRDTGVSMAYTSIILFFGFSIFTASEFGGTVALGFLVSITLLVAMMSNLILLPSLLLSLERRIVSKSFEEPMIHIFDEEEDIDLDELTIEGRKELLDENPEK